MPPDLALVVKKTDVHGTGMQINTTLKWVLFRVASHEVSFLFRPWLFSQGQHTTGGMLRGEASIIITGVQLTASSLR